ncbi:MAG: NAD(P)-dependent oxidoreductase [Rhizobacter sp.]
MTTVFVSHPAHRLDIYFGERALGTLRSFADVRLNPEPRDLSTPELIAAAQGCDALIAYRQTCAPEALFAGLPQLAAFLRCAMDIRTVDVTAASHHGVLVTRASAGFNAAVAEWIIAVMLDLGRGVSRYAEAYHRGKPLPPVLGRELRGATLGIIGFGGIGRTVCELALAFGMRVLVNTPQAVETRDRVTPLSLHALLGDADFVVCLAPANEHTTHLIDAAALSAMKPGAFFINASRGELVDERALLDALDSGRLGGCALDVGLAPDQMPSPELARHPRVIATPHIGGLTQPATEHQAIECVDQLQTLLRGKTPPGAVNAELATRWHSWAHTSPQTSPHSEPSLG